MHPVRQATHATATTYLVVPVIPPVHDNPQGGHVPLPISVSLRLLRSFVAVSEECHVGRAAARLFVSQPSLSQDIRRLEREVGVQLFVRGARGMVLTPAGEELVRSVAAGLALVDRGVDAARRIAALDRHPMVLAFTPSVGNKLMPRLLPVIEERLAKVAIDEREVDTGEVGPGVRAGRYDAGLAHCPTAEQGLMFDLLVEEPLVVALAAHHPLASASEIHLAQLAEMALLIWPRETAPDYYDHLLWICEQAGIRPRLVRGPRRAMVRSYLLSDGTTFSLLPRSTATLRTPGLAFVPVADREVCVPLVFVRRAGDERTELVQIEEVAREVSAILADSC